MVTQADGADAFQIGPRSARPERRLDVLRLLLAAFVAVVLYLAALLLELRPPRGLAVAFFAAAPILATLAIVVLEHRARTTGDRRLAWVSAGLAVGVVAMVLQLVSFPAVTPGGGLLSTGDDASASLYLLFHLSLGAGAVAGALGAPPRWRLPSVLAGWLLALLLALDRAALPQLISADTYFTPLLVGIELLLAALLAAATALWVVRVGRSAAETYSWIGVALSLSVYDVLLNAAGGERYGAVWWASLSLRVATYLVLVLGPLVSVLRQLRDAESWSENELDRREAQLRTSLSVTESLLSSAEALSSAVTSREVAEQLSTHARVATRVTFASLLAGRRGGPLHLVGASGCSDRMLEQLVEIDWDVRLPAPYAVATGEPLFLDSPSQVRQRFPRLAGTAMAEAAALAALPVRLGKDVIGVLSLWDPSPHPWSPTERRMLAGLAAHGGQAMARAQAYEAAADAARTLQASLLPPRLPRTDRLELAARYVPAQDGVLVGGDWYDSLLLDDGQVALVVGDVMGKGLHAAALMGRIRMAVRSVARLDPAPSAVLAALDSVNLELAEDEIVTMAYVLLDPGRGVARVARAGHLPPLLVRPDGSVEAIEAGGSAPLGASFGQRRSEARFAMPAGSLLVLYTDGLVEDRATGLDRGMSLLTHALATMTPLGETTAELAARLLAECADGAAADDIALLLARSTPAASTRAETSSRAPR